MYASWMLLWMVMVGGGGLVGCAAAHARMVPSDPAAQRWVKPRVDLLVGQARKYVVIARYAERMDDVQRAAREYTRAWCIDKGSLWLQEQIDHYQDLGMIATPPHCYPHP